MSGQGGDGGSKEGRKTGENGRGVLASARASKAKAALQAWVFKSVQSRFLWTPGLQERNTAARQGLSRQHPLQSTSVGRAPSG